MGNFAAKEKKAIGHSSTFTSKAVAKTIHQTPVKQHGEQHASTEIIDINLDKALHALIKDIDFNIEPGFFGSVIPGAEMWGRNKKIARVQEYMQRAVAVVNDLKTLAAAQQDFRARQLVHYEVMTLTLTLARAKQEILTLQNANNSMLQDVNERIARAEREERELRQKLDIERESHALSMEERRLQIRIKELQAKLLEQQLEE